MKFVCSNCERLVALEDFRVEGGVLVARCSKCGSETRSQPPGEPREVEEPRVPAPAPSAPPRPALALASAGHSNVVALRTPVVEAVEAAAKAASSPFEVPDGLCPKCLTPRLASAQECHACGLSFERGAPEGLEPAGWLSDAWVELLAHWDDEARHESLRNLAVERGELAPVGRLYRLRLAWQPQDPFAVKGRDEVLRLALLPSTAPAKKPAAEEGGRWKWVLVLVVFVASSAALVALAYNLLKEH